MTTAAARDGRMYVLDIGEPDVKVFYRCRQIRTLHWRSGAGPDEFTHPGSLLLTDEPVIVGDFMQGLSTTFTLEGKHLATRRYKTAAAGAAGHLVHELRGGSALLVIAPHATNRRDSVMADLYGNRHPPPMDLYEPA